MNQCDSISSNFNFNQFLIKSVTCLPTSGMMNVCLSDMLVLTNTHSYWNTTLERSIYDLPLLSEHLCILRCF